MEVYLIRHTKPDLPKGICYGQSDIDVAGSFQSEFDMIRHKAPENVHKIYSSPLKRCTRLAEKLGFDVILDHRLKEMNFGNWEMKPWGSIPQEELDPWMTDFVNVRVPNGESFQDLIDRVKAFLEALRAEELERVIIVSHAGIIRSILGYFLEMKPSNFFKIQIDFGGVSMVKVDKDIVNVEFINR